jgi:hypothetical protein
MATPHTSNTATMPIFLNIIHLRETTHGSLEAPARGHNPRNLSPRNGGQAACVGR